MNQLIKNALLIFTFFISQFSFAYSIDSNSKKNNDRLEQIELNQKNSIDSLKRELLFFKVKEDYYAEALSDQSTRFSLIAGSIIGLFTLISFAGFKIEVAQLKKDYKKQIQLFKDQLLTYQSKTRDHDNSMQSASGRIFTLIAESYNKADLPDIAFDYYLYSTKAHSSSAKLLIDDNKGDDGQQSLLTAKANMELALESLKKIPKALLYQTELEKNYEKTMITLNIISKVDHQELVDLCAECRITIKSLLGK